MGRFGVGQPVRRKEDARFLTGAGRYIEDMVLPREARAVFVRSPLAHAALRGVDAAEAAAMPGVLAIFTGADLEADGIGHLGCITAVPNRDGSPHPVPPRPALAVGRVRHVGEAVAMVVAETLAQAQDAAELVLPDYEELPAVADLRAAAQEGAPQVWDEAPGNLCLDWEAGDRAAVEAAFAEAAHVTRLSLVNNRIIVNSIETRGAIGEFDARDGRFTLHTATQGGHKLRAMLAKSIFHVPEARVRVVTPDVGGGFGMKIYLYPEHVCCLWAARLLGRPVKWIGDRAESFLSDAQARDQWNEGALALNADGRIMALRIDSLANLGAYLSMYGPYIPTVAGTVMMPGIYEVPAAYAAMRCLFTNTVPVDAYRGAGKPEVNTVVERLLDEAAAELAVDPAELRRRNLVPPERVPYTTVMKQRIDSADFPRVMNRVVQDVDFSSLPARKDGARKAGLLRGLGFSGYMENTAGYQEEMARVRIDPQGRATLTIGTQSNGQGHETTFAQVLSERTGIDLDRIEVVQGDTDLLMIGHGTGGSRSLAIGGAAVGLASDKVVAKARRIAGHLLEAAEADIALEDGRFVVAGTDKAVGWTEVAKAAWQPPALAKEIEPGLEESGVYRPEASSYPNGVHVAEVDVDPETGSVALVRYVVADDFGTVVNPMIVAGQVHGGVAQGIGQALTEGAVYDAEGGQLLTGSFMDYGIPRADDLPDFEVAFEGTPCRTNPLGVKGCGEAGTIVAPGAVMNAIVDALRPLGVRHVDMPATPERVWRAIQDANGTGRTGT